MNHLQCSWAGRKCGHSRHLCYILLLTKKKNTHYISDMLVHICMIQGHPWLLEARTRPQLVVYSKQIKDQSQYHISCLNRKQLVTSAGYWQLEESSKVADTRGTVNVGDYPSALPPTWQLNRADRSCGHSSMSSDQWELGCKWRRWTHPLLSDLWCRNLSPCWLRCGLRSSPLLTVRIPCHSQKQAEDTNSHHNRLQGLVIWHSFQPSRVTEHRQ